MWYVLDDVYVYNNLTTFPSFNVFVVNFSYWMQLDNSVRAFFLISMENYNFVKKVCPYNCYVYKPIVMFII